MCKSLSNTKLDVLFFVKKTKLLKNGEAPVCMRVTVDARRAELMIKRSVTPSKWNQKKECATATDYAGKELNPEINVDLFSVISLIFKQIIDTGIFEQLDE